MEKTPHILIVDDNREIRDLLARYFTKNDMRVDVANGGPEMRQQMRARSFDLVVLDIMMPGKDGLTLCRQLRQSSDIPIVLLTAVSEETDRIVGLELGADDYVTKPFNPRDTAPSFGRGEAGRRRGYQTLSLLPQFPEPQTRWGPRSY